MVNTSAGAVEVAITSGTSGTVGPVVVCFPGGHATACTPLGTDLYTELGYRVLTFSRPGYGRTHVGDRNAVEFVPVVAEVCERLGIAEATATVGISFGGMQAVEVAVALPQLAPRLILHSCAPSTLPYPDTTLERHAASLVFGPLLQAGTWRLLRLLTSSERGLRLMMSSLSMLPTEQWWHTWTATDRDAARATFARMDSGSGFVTDIRHAGDDHSYSREASLRAVGCPTLVTASHHDGGVSFTHAEDFVRTIAQTRLVDTDAPSHLYWIGPTRAAVAEAICTFMAH